MSTLKRLIVTAVILMIITVGLLLAYLGFKNRLGEEILLPLVAIAGVVCLLLAMTLVALIFARVGLADKAQALGLPEGSVRAVIALALVILFAIVSVFLYGSFVNGTGNMTRFSVSTQAEATSLLERAARADSAFDATIVPPKEGETGPFQVIYRSRINREASEFAKQLLILIGTLVTSVASFYFGSRTVASAQEAMAALVSPYIGDPRPGRRGCEQRPSHHSRQQSRSNDGCEAY
ncbi:MAG TPA: hypothetical protein VGG03_19385 [Thermoanaerobaculia bacterium]